MSKITVEDLQQQVRELKDSKGFEVSLEQRLAYLTSELGEVATEVLKLSRNGSSDVGKMNPSEVDIVRKRLGMEIYDVVWNLLDLAELSGVDLEESFSTKARLNANREW